MIQDLGIMMISTAIKSGVMMEKETKMMEDGDGDIMMEIETEMSLIQSILDSDIDSCVDDDREGHKYDGNNLYCGS